MPERFLKFEGHRFHFVWLRDNCICPECRHPTSFQKLFDLSTLPTAPQPEQVTANNSGLTILWKGQPPHRSVYAAAWLRAHAYDATRPSESNLVRDWDPSALERVHDIDSCSVDGGPWSDDLTRLGFVRFRNLDQKKCDAFLSGIGPIHYTEYGRFAPVRAVPGANDLAETGHALTPHTDYSTYMHTAPLLQLMMMVRNDASGGESVLVDGYSVANAFRRDHPEMFTLLSTIPVEFQQFYTDWKFFLQRKRPVIELNDSGRVNGIYFGHSHAANWQIDFGDVERYYEAYSTFLTYLKDPKFEFVFRMDPGDAVAVQNSRVLHGRRAFDAESGERHLQVGYVAWEHLEARLRFHRYRDLYLC